MKIRIHTQCEIIDIETSVNIGLKEIVEQLENGSTVLIETKDNRIFIINCINVNAIEIIN